VEDVATLQRSPDRRVADRPATQGHDGVVSAQGVENNVTLDRAKAGFAPLLEYLFDRDSGSSDDLGIGVDEGQAQARCEQPADGRLTRSHEADENDHVGLLPPIRSR
jgi:hypothetical protein